MRGSQWRESLIVGGSGATGFPIRIRAYGEGSEPTICGDEKLTNWVVQVSPEGMLWRWHNPLGPNVGQIFRGNEVLTKAVSVSALKNLEWCIENGSLVLRDDDGDPNDENASLYGVIRDRPIDCRSQSNLIIDGIVVRGGRSAGLFVSKSTDISVTRCRLERSVQNAQIENSSNVTFSATMFGQSVGRGIYVTGSDLSLVFRFCVMTPGPVGGPSLSIDSSRSFVDLINCTLVGSRTRHVSNVGSNIVNIVNCILSVPASSDQSQIGEEIKNTNGTVTVRYSLIQPNGQWPTHLVDGATVGPGCIYTSPGFLRNASKGFICLGMDDSGSFGAFTNLLRMADARKLKVYLALDGNQDWAPMRPALQSAILNGHDIMCHTTSHALLDESNAMTIRYSGEASTATVTVNNNVMLLSLDGTNYSSIALDGSGIAKNVSRLMTAVKALPNFTASLATSLEPAVPSSYLENVAGVNIKSPVVLRWDMPRKWTNELQMWRQKLRDNFVDADGFPYDSVYVAYPSGLYDETVIQKLVEFGFRGGRTTNPAGKKVNGLDFFRLNSAPVFNGRGAQIRFNGDVNDSGGERDFTAVNLTYSAEAIEGSHSGVFNGSSGYAWRQTDSSWDFSLGDWQVAFAMFWSGGTNEQTLFYQGSDASNNLLVAVSEEGQVIVSVTEDGAEKLRVSTPTRLLTVGDRWHRIKIRQTANLWRIYVDGNIEAETNSPTRCKAYSGNVLIGCEPDGDSGLFKRHYLGQLDDFSQSSRTYMNTQALMDVAAQAGFIYIIYTHGFVNSPEIWETVLDAAAEYPGGSASLKAPVAAFEDIYSSSIVISNRWVTLTNLPPPDYRLSLGSKAIGAGDPSGVRGLPNVIDMNGFKITDSKGDLLIAEDLFSLGAYQPLFGPAVRIEHDATIIRISWPHGSGAWRLYSAIGLSNNTLWEPVDSIPALVESNWVVETSLSPGHQRFFRLHAE